MRMFRLMPTVFSFAVAVISTSAYAQPGAVPSHASRCISARDAATHASRISAVQRDLMGCDAESADVLPAHWRTAGADTANLNALIVLSERVRDKRILENVASAARSERNPVLVRGAALIVLASYYNPIMSGRVSVDSTGGVHISIGPRTHISQRDGPQPFVRSDDIVVEQTLRAIAAEPVSYVQKWARNVLKFNDELCQQPRSRAQSRICP